MTATYQQQWKEQYDRTTKEAIKRFEDLTPEPLYESALPEGHRLCLVCGNQPAHSALRTPSKPEPIVPLCRNCSADWNCYGYGILKKIRPAPLVLKMAKWLVLHPTQCAAVWGDLRRLLRWQKKMSHIRKTLKEQKS